MNMKTRKLGKTGLNITPIGLGCWQFSQGFGFIGSFWDALAQGTMTEIVKTALEGGINWFDTAEAYGKGKSEESLAAALNALGRKPGDVFIATKWMPFLRTAVHLVSSIGERQKRLNPYPIDLIQIHFPASFSSIEKQAMGLARLLKEKQVRSVGVSNFNPVQMRTVAKVLEGEGLVLASNQVRYNLADRKIETDGTLETAKELGITIIAYSPLAQGLLTGRFHDDPSTTRKVNSMRRSRLNEKALERTRPLINALKQIAKSYQAGGVTATPSQVALNWLVNFHGDAVVAIPGASKPKQAFESSHALDFNLTKEELKRIDQLSKEF